MPRKYVVTSMLLCLHAVVAVVALSRACADQPVAETALKIAERPPAQTTCYYGVMGEVVRPGVYPDASPSVRLADVLRACGGPTTGAILEVAHVRNGQLSRHKLDPRTLDAHISAGDVIVVLGSQPPSGITPGRVRVSTSGKRATSPASAASAATISQPEVQLAFINLLDRPVILKMTSATATPRHIVKSLGQPAEIIPTIKVIEASLGNVVDYAEPDRHLTSGSVLVFDPELIRRERIPRGLMSIPLCVPQANEAPAANSLATQDEALDLTDDEDGPSLTARPERPSKSVRDSDTPAYLTSRRAIGQGGPPPDAKNALQDAAAPAEPCDSRLSTIALSGPGCSPGTTQGDPSAQTAIIAAGDPAGPQSSEAASWWGTAGSIFTGSIGLLMMGLLAISLRRMAKRETTVRARTAKSIAPQSKLLDALIENRLPIEEEACLLPARLEFIGRRKGAREIFVDASHEVGSPHESMDTAAPAADAAHKAAGSFLRTDAARQPEGHGRPQHRVPDDNKQHDAVGVHIARPAAAAHDDALPAGKRIDARHAGGLTDRPALESATLLDRVLARVQGVRHS